ncbi:MAG: enoyl-CoA hydratase/isomerase family protein [Dehalococcoidales bacterium]|nr:enoyl-CoA hydratase/isomerase family protein [Dehalococcoidales bacterium]
MEYKQIIYQPGKVARVILNRPRYLNAQSVVMREELDDAFARAMEDEEVGALVLSGAGDHFCSGHDISTHEDQEDRQARGFSRDRFARYKNMRAITLENTLRWRNLPKPTIAMVHGYCIFGGWIFAAAMDIIFASEDALLLPSHVQYFSVPWELGPRRTKEILFEHRFMTAWEACEDGFVNRVYPREKLEVETLAFAERVAENYLSDPMRIRTTKFSVNHMEDTMGFTAAVEAAYQSFFVLAESGDQQIPHPEQGGYAQTHVARRNLELSKDWLESRLRH